MSSKLSADEKAAQRKVACPWCGALAGYGCRNGSGLTWHPHHQRVDRYLAGLEREKQDA